MKAPYTSRDQLLAYHLTSCSLLTWSFLILTRSAPKCPAIFRPGNTLPGVAEAPTEPCCL